MYFAINQSLLVNEFEICTIYLIDDKLSATCGSSNCCENVLYYQASDSRGKGV